ncbi:MAG: hypothetical protein AAFQ82_19630, partial [Myxococcota bacterium]
MGTTLTFNKTLGALERKDIEFPLVETTSLAALPPELDRRGIRTAKKSVFGELLELMGPQVARPLSLALFVDPRTPVPTIGCVFLENQQIVPIALSNSPGWRARVALFTAQMSGELVAVLTNKGVSVMLTEISGSGSALEHTGAWIERSAPSEYRAEEERSKKAAFIAPF